MNTVVCYTCNLYMQGIDREGHKELLGMYISRNEGANFWLSVLTDLQNREVKDILIACIYGLKGFPETIQSVNPNISIQLCVAHQIRNSIAYSGGYPFSISGDIRSVPS